MGKFDRLIPNFGEENLFKLQNHKVLILGLGGVGGFVVESIARMGISTIGICDGDKIELSNFNRQLIALDSTLNQNKVAAFKKRINDINANIKVNEYDYFIDEKTISSLDIENYDLVLDCIDDVKAKILVIEKCKSLNVEIISCMGTGNKSNPQQFEICDINQTSYCPLAKKVRTELRKKGINKLKVCFSTEIPQKNNQNIISSQIYVVGSAGLLIASEAIKYLNSLQD